MKTTLGTNNKRKEYPNLTFRTAVWKKIAEFVAKDAPLAETVVELGAGYCDFINQFEAPGKICYELNGNMRQWSNDEVNFICTNALELSKIPHDSVDLIFASNFLEHLDSSTLDALLLSALNALRKHGRLILLQPNYRLCSKHYFDDETHQTIFSDDTIGDFLEKSGFTIKKIIPGLLPFSMKSRLPKWPILVKLYLWSPIRPGAAQMYIVAEKE